MESSGNEAVEKNPDEELVFVWQDYLDATESTEVPQILFPHVELTLQSGIEIGMSLEVPNGKSTNNEDISYWIGSIVMACGPLLRLRYFGGDDRSLEFWFNLTKEAAHEVGWCEKNGKQLQPPEEIEKRSPDCCEKLGEFLSNTKTVPQEMLSGEGLSMVDRIKQGMKVEVSDIRHPYKLWLATIIENVGGRLLLRYDTPGSSPMKDFWIFCTSEHLHRHGFSASSSTKSKWFLEPPTSIIDTHTYEEWKELTENGSKDYDHNESHFDNIKEHEKHKFQRGMKLETISPADRTKICPASVVKVFDDIYFLVKIDIYDEEDSMKDLNDSFVYDSAEKDTWLCTADHPYIFPVGWAEKHEIQLTHPQGWISKSLDFNWQEYLRTTDTLAADDSFFSPKENAQEIGFEIGMRLEAVDPENENVICAAHVTKIIDNLLWLKLDNYEDCRPEHVVHMNSLHIFPVGWCESNHYPLKPPKDYVEICGKIQPTSMDLKKSQIETPNLEPRSSLWCPKIYFNYRCFTGPMISKGKLATLPKAVGPGPVILVMREVLSMIVSVGYRSARILKVLQCDAKPKNGYHLEVLKAKHKNNTYRASVAVVTSGDMVADFCRMICKKLMVCPNLFGPVRVLQDECPDRCHKTQKTKFTAPVGNGKRGKPKGYTSIMVQKPKPWGGRRKRRRGRWANRDKENDDDEQDEDMPYLSMDLTKHISNSFDESCDGRVPSSTENDYSKCNQLEKFDDFKIEAQSSNGSEDSRSSFNDRKSKDSNFDSPGSSGGKSQTKLANHNGATRTRGIKRERDDTSVESDDASEIDVTYTRGQKKTTKKPKNGTLDSNPLFWSVDDVFRYLRKTNDCKDIAYRVKQEEIDGLAFLLLNLPSLTQHMNLRTSAAMKLCRHVEQVKVTFFLRYVNEAD